MVVERKFIEDALARYRVEMFLREKLERVGLSGVTIQRTPMVTRITVEVANPGRLIGKKGRSIKKLTDVIAQEFGVKDPQIAVVPVENVELEPQLMGRFIARNIETGRPIRPTIHSALKKIMDAGALGAEIRVSGKIVAKGGKAKSLRVAAGYLPKAGEVTELLKKASVIARPQYGAVNVAISITPPGVSFPDKEIKKVELARVIKYAEEKALPEIGKGAEAEREAAVTPPSEREKEKGRRPPRRK